MKLTSLDFYLERIQLIGLVCIIICAATWALDLLEFVYACPYCRVQRSVIGILGLILVLQKQHNWIMLYVASVFGFMGASTAAAQNFRKWAQISSGEFKFYDPIYLDSFFLSAAAMFIIVGQVWLIALSVRRSASAGNSEKELPQD